MFSIVLPSVRPNHLYRHKARQKEGIECRKLLYGAALHYKAAEMTEVCSLGFMRYIMAPESCLKANFQ